MINGSASEESDSVRRYDLKGNKQEEQDVKYIIEKLMEEAFDIKSKSVDDGTPINEAEKAYNTIGTILQAHPNLCAHIFRASVLKEKWI